MCSISVICSSSELVYDMKTLRTPHRCILSSHCSYSCVAGLHRTTSRQLIRSSWYASPSLQAQTNAIFALRNINTVMLHSCIWDSSCS